MHTFSRNTIGTLCLALAASLGLSACAPLVIGGAVVAASVAVDRRTAGTQLEDEAIALKTLSALNGQLGPEAHVNADSYNRQVLLTGEVASEAARQHATQLAQGVENVRAVFNELQVMPASSLSERSNDTWITSKVRSQILADGRLPAKSIKVTTERSVVYLQGLVTPPEAQASVEIARNVSGVVKVVSMFEFISEAELQKSQAENAAHHAAPGNNPWTGPNH